jgi:carboxypeptidase C (cathepsin A)
MCVTAMAHFRSYILGESYAGVYVPTIVKELWADPGERANTLLRF